MSNRRTTTITKVKVRKLHNKNRLRGVAAIEINNEISLNDIRIIEYEPGKLTAKFPYHKLKHSGEKYYFVSPLNGKIASYLEKTIVDEFVREGLFEPSKELLNEQDKKE